MFPYKQRCERSRQHATSQPSMSEPADTWAYAYKQMNCLLVLALVASLIASFTLGNKASMTYQEIHKTPSHRASQSSNLFPREASLAHCSTLFVRTRFTNSCTFPTIFSSTDGANGPASRVRRIAPVAS